MQQFSYRARNHLGESQTGVIEADSVETVANQLLHNQLTPINIDPVKENSQLLKNLKQQLDRQTVDDDELIILTRQLYTLNKAGIPIMKALESLAGSSKNPLLKRTLRDVSNTLEEGRDLATALMQHHRVFPPLFINIVRVGETTGRLDEALLQLAEYLELDKENEKRIKSALRYPTFIMLAMVAAMFVINLFVIPSFSKVFASFDSELPWATQLLLATSNFMVAWWPHILVTAALAIAALRQWINSPKGGYLWDKWKLRMPIFGDIVLRANLGRFTRSLAVTSQSGVPLIQAMNIVAGSIDNKFLESRITTMKTGIENGESLTRTAAATGLFTPLILQMFSVGEQTGAIDELLLETAEHYDREVKYELQNISSSIEPIMITIIGVMVLILALGIFLPMWDLADSVR